MFCFVRQPGRMSCYRPSLQLAYCTLNTSRSHRLITVHREAVFCFVQFVWAVHRLISVEWNLSSRLLVLYYTTIYSTKSFHMDRVLQPARFETDVNDTNAGKRWSHWLKTFENFLSSISSHSPNKLAVLINFLSPEVYGYISEYSSYNDALDKLKSLYVKPKNEVYAHTPDISLLTDVKTQESLSTSISKFSNK